MNKYSVLHCHSHYSLLDGLSKPKQIAERIAQLGLDSCALTDHGNISGSVQFVKAMQARNLKAILGNEMYISDTDASLRNKENRATSHLVVLAKNLNGWKSLIKMTSHSNNPELFYHKPRLDKTLLAPYGQSGNLISFSGHLGSALSSVLFTDPKQAFNSKTEAQARSLLKVNWDEAGKQLALEYQQIFGKGNFFIEIQLIDKICLPSQIVVANCLRQIAAKTGIPCVATPDSHYISTESSSDQRILLCTNLKTNLAAVEAKLENDEDVMLGGFFKSQQYHIPSYEEMALLHTEEELQNTLLISDMCENYNILNKPILPPFQCPNGMNSEEYLRQLCRDGWSSKIKGKISKDREQEYADRVKYELEVLQGAGLSSYFLVLQDIVKYIRSNQWMTSPGRGSAAGCLVSYLVGITGIDPIPYDLMFERFYNAGRNTVEKISMPDIDMDVPVQHREQVIEYIKEKYGHDKVAQIISFQTMKGRGALKDVLRAYSNISFEEMNRITEHIPDEAKIADELQEMREEDGEASIIGWALKNNAEQLKPWCFIDDDGKLQGPLSKRFEQAIRLEGTKAHASKHAAGIVISPEPLADICPMVLDGATKNQMAGFEMNDLEAIGLIKLDILGITMLDKTMGVRNILATGKL